MFKDPQNTSNKALNRKKRLTNIRRCGITLLLLMCLSDNPKSQSTTDNLGAAYRTFNEAIFYWQQKPANYVSAYKKFLEFEQYSNRLLIINPFKTYDEIKTDAFNLKDANRRFVRFMMNMNQMQPDLCKKLNGIELAWNMSEKIKSVNFRYEILKSLIAKQTPQHVSVLRSLFNQIEKAESISVIKDLEVKINEIIPEYKVLSQQSVSLDEIRSLLKENEVLLSFFMNDNRRQVFVWRIQRNQPVQIVTLKINTADLFFRIECLKADFERDSAYKNALTQFFIPTEKFDNRDGRKPAPAFTQEGYSVRENLAVFAATVIKPLNLTPGAKIIIACDQNISSLPFEILPHNGKMMMDYFGISYVPSVKVFYFLRYSKRRTNSIVYDSYIGFGYDDNGRMSVSELNSFGGAKSIRIVKATETDIYSNSQNISRSRILHFSTHGRVQTNINDTKAQYLQYYPDRLNDGKLTSAEVTSNLVLNESLVVLSACQTAPSQDIKDYFKIKETFVETKGNSGQIVSYIFGGCICSYGETFSNLTSSFFIAGARSMIMTQWDVRAKESNEFFEIFYEKLAEYNDVYRALKETKRDLINRENYSSFSSFIMVSD